MTDPPPGTGYLVEALQEIAAGAGMGGGISSEQIDYVLVNDYGVDPHRAPAERRRVRSLLAAMRSTDDDEDDED